MRPRRQTTRIPDTLALARGRASRCVGAHTADTREASKELARCRQRRREALGVKVVAPPNDPGGTRTGAARAVIRSITRGMVSTARHEVTTARPSPRPINDLRGRSPGSVHLRHGENRRALSPRATGNGRQGCSGRARRDRTRPWSHRQGQPSASARHAAVHW